MGSENDAAAKSIERRPADVTDWPRWATFAASEAYGIPVEVQRGRDRHRFVPSKALLECLERDWLLFRGKSHGRRPPELLEEIAKGRIRQMLTSFKKTNTQRVWEFGEILKKYARNGEAQSIARGGGMLSVIRAGCCAEVVLAVGRVFASHRHDLTAIWPAMEWWLKEVRRPTNDSGAPDIDLYWTKQFFDALLPTNPARRTVPPAFTRAVKIIQLGKGHEWSYVDIGIQYLEREMAGVWALGDDGWEMLMVDAENAGLNARAAYYDAERRFETGGSA
jgi:hypothetical protein